MLTNFSKVLAVATAFISIAVLGVAFVVFAGGPNWRAEAAQLKEYEFTRSEGEKPTWSAKTRRARAQGGGAPATQTVAQNTVALGDAIVKAREDLKKTQQEEIAALDRAIPPLQATIAEAKDFNQKDLEAMKKREKQLVDERTAQETEIDRLSKEAIAKGQEAQAIGVEIERRRNDAFRLTNELDNLRTDRFRLSEQQKQLEALLVRMRGNRARLESRVAQLQAQGAVGSGDSAAGNDAKAEDAKPEAEKPKDDAPEKTEEKSE